MIYTVSLNPALDKTIQVSDLKINSVNRIEQMRADPGGKGINVSKGIAQLGGKSIAIGILGGATGRIIQQALESMGLETRFFFVRGETRTNIKIVDPVNHTNTDINEPGMSVSEEVLERMLGQLLEWLRPDDVAVLSGSIPGGASKDTYRRWTEACRKQGAKVFLDADGQALAAGLKAAPYLIKPNHHELAAFAGRQLETTEELAGEARRLMERWKIQKVVVSMGARGALYVTEEQILYAEGLKVPVGSTVGAGDSMVAALAWAEERHMSLEEAARLSSAAGAANVMCSGTQAAEYEAICRLMPQVKLFRLR